MHMERAGFLSHILKKTPLSVIKLSTGVKIEQIIFSENSKSIDNNSPKSVSIIRNVLNRLPSFSRIE